MITLYGYGPLGDTLDLSPFVAKVEAYLRLAGLEYRKAYGNPRRAPRGKLPVLKHEGRVVPDSGLILDYLRDHGLADLDDGLDEAARAELVAMRALLEDSLYFALLYFRWQLDQGWSTYRSHLGAAIGAAGVPKWMLPLILRSARASATRQTRAQGTGARPMEENLERVRSSFAALEVMVARSGGPWWLGARPSSADAVAHAFVGAALVPHLGLPTESLAEACPALRRWFAHADAAIRAQRPAAGLGAAAPERV